MCRKTPLNSKILGRVEAGTYSQSTVQVDRVPGLHTHHCKSNFCSVNLSAVDEVWLLRSTSSGRNKHANGLSRGKRNSSVYVVVQDPLASTWTVHVSKSTGLMYYHNSSTNRSTYDMPNELKRLQEHPTSVQVRACFNPCTIL